MTRRKQNPPCAQSRVAPEPFQEMDLTPKIFGVNSLPAPYAAKPSKTSIRDAASP